MALAIDKYARPADALILADALTNGAAGISPVSGQAPTAHLGTSASTRVMGDDSPTAATRIAQRQPTTGTTPGPPRRPASPVPARRPRAASRRPRARGSHRDQHAGVACAGCSGLCCWPHC